MRTEYYQGEVTPQINRRSLLKPKKYNTNNYTTVAVIRRYPHHHQLQVSFLRFQQEIVKLVK